MAMTSSLISISNTGAGPAGLPLPADNLRPNRHSDREIDPHHKPPNVSARDVPVPSPSLLPLLLQYLLPPSPAGLPPHLLSRALSSRHLYLNIEASSDLRAYYALTSASTPAVEVLEEIGACRRAEDGLDSIIAHTGYTSEGGFGVDGAVETKSFVQLRSEGREVWVVLIWEEGEWKYTDVRSAPLLEELSSTPTLAIASIRNRRNTKSTAKATKVVIQTPLANELAEGDDSGDDYWGRYGANSDSEDEESGVPRNGPTPFQKTSKGKGKANSSGTRSANEDAYWAQYGVGSVTASPGISPRVTLMPVQQQYGSNIDGEEAENRELRIAIEQALTRLPVNPQPGAPKARMLNLASISPVLRSSSSSSNRQAPPDTNASSIFSSDSHQGSYNHSAPHPQLYTLSTRYARDSITNETLNLHRGPLLPTGGTARGLALDLNTPPPTEHTISITSVLPTLGSPTSAVAPVFATAGSGPMARMSPLLVGMGSPVVDAVERSMVSGVATHATGGSVAEPIQEPGEPVSLLDTLMREGRAAVATSSSNRTDGDSTKEPDGDSAYFAGDEAVLQSVRGIFRMWRILRGTTRDGSITGDANTADLDWNAESMEAKREFLNLVVRALANS